MAFVVDASVVAAWLLPDESTSKIETLFDRFAVEGANAPDVLRHEMRSIAIKAVRRKRIDAAQAEILLRRFETMRIRDCGPGTTQNVIDLALQHGLTAYDAAYLSVARSERLELATLDANLRAAARSEGVAILPRDV